MALLAGILGCSSVIVPLLTFMLHTRCGSSTETGSSTSILSRLFSDYDQVIRPDFGVRPTEVLADLYVESFGNIEEANMEYKVFGYLRQQWKDGRLAGKINETITIKGENIKRLWLPDPFCYNARETNLMLPDSAIHSRVSIDKQGNVFYTRGVTFLASCEMDLRHFPFDAQECSLKLGSYAYKMDDIIYKWKYDAVKVESTLMAQFDYLKASLSTSAESFAIGNFSTITVTYFFKRRIGFYLIQVYFPDMFVIALSWIVFWMDKNDMGNRMALGITTILTIMFLLGSLNGFMPRVSYAKALDWYLLVSFTFASLCLVECMIVFLVWLQENTRKDYMKGEDRTSLNSPSVRKVSFHGGQYGVPVDDKSDKSSEVHILNHGCQSNNDAAICENTSFLGHKVQQETRQGTRADFIDKISRGLFPFSFLIFNVVYWCYFLLVS